jgi:predicted lipoprotein with Yx(FWY)xxD motif
MRRKRTFVVLVAVGVLAAACGDDAADDTTTTTAPAATTTAPDDAVGDEPTDTTEAPDPTDDETVPEDGPFLQTGESAYGRILTDDEGMTVYLFLPDSQGPSTCTGTCAETWPPLLGEFAAGPGVDATLFGSAARDDGSTQVTYDGWPLYYYAPDTEPGDTEGQAFNGVWWVVAPSGEAVMSAGSGDIGY